MMARYIHLLLFVGVVIYSTTDADIVCPTTSCSFEPIVLDRATSWCLGYCQCSLDTVDGTYYWQGKACASGTMFDTNLRLCNWVSATTCEVLGQICFADNDCQGQLSGTICQDHVCVCSLGQVEGSPTVACKSDNEKVLDNIMQRSQRVSSCAKDDAEAFRECEFVQRRISDHSIEETWYSFQDYQLSVYHDSAAIGACGTYYPIYLKEPLPSSVADGEVEVTVVVVGLKKYGVYDYKIKARQRRDTILYFLPPAPVEFAAYCLESPPSPIPDYTIRYINVVPHLLFDSVEPPMLSFSCNFSVVDGYLYTVTWLSGDTVIIESDILPSIMALQFLLTTGILTKASIGYTLDLPIRCAVRVDSPTGNSLLPNSYSQDFAAIEVLRDDITIGRTGDTTLSIKLNVKFGCLPVLGEKTCQLMIIVYDPEDAYDCQDSTIAIRSSNNCGANIQGIVSEADTNNGPVGEVIQIAITTKNNNKYKLKTKFQLKIRTKVHGIATQIWTRELAATITVTVADETTWKGKTCYANNDPRVSTGDGVHYYLMLTDVFIMYRHKFLPLEVQIKTVSCNGGWASCICAVTVRQGRDIYTVNYCGSNPFTDYISTLDNTLTVYDISCTRWKVVFQHGTVVDISVSPWRHVVNVIISLSPGDLGNIEGLCGHFDGRPDNDFTHSDGTVDAESDYRWQWTSHDYFSKSWGLGYRGLLEAQDLLVEGNAETDLWGNIMDKRMCVCPNNGLDEPLCSINEDDTCTKPIYRGGTPIVKPNQEPRSAHLLNLDIARRLKNIQDESKSHVVKRQAVENPDRISEEDAFLLCVEYFTSSCPMYQYDDVVPFIHTNETLRECSQDVAINPNADWQGLYCEVYVTQVSIELTKDTEYQETHAEETAAIKEISCPSNCYKHGSCVNGKCVCEPGYGTDECLLETTGGVTINDVTGGGVCDTSIYGDCSCILIMGTGFVRDATCRITITNFMFDHMDGSLTVESETYEDNAVIYRSLTEVFCCVDGLDDRRAAGDTVKVAQQYGMSASNDGTSYGNTRNVFVLDSRCMEIVTDKNGTHIVWLKFKAGYCYISGSCVTDGTSDASNASLVCRCTTDMFGWTTERPTTPLVTTTTTKPAATGNVNNNKRITVVAVCVTGSLLMLAIFTLMAYKYFKNPKLATPVVMQI